jgi:tetratricopeptide (TPR) repeat protein
MEDYQGIEKLKEAIDLDNTLDEAWALLAQAYMQKNDTESAFRIAKEWKEMNKVEGANLEAYLHLQLGNNQQARAILGPLIKANPDHFSALRFLMLLNANEKKFDDARPLAEKLVKLDKNNLQSYFALVNISIAQDKAKEIENQLLNDLDNNPSPEQSMVIKTSLGKLYNYQNRPELTTKLEWNNTISNDDALTVLGEAYFILKDYSSVYQIYNSWLGERSTNIIPWMKLLEMFDYTREYEMGLRAALKSAAVFSDNVGIETYIVKFQIKNGLIKPAKKLLEEISLRNPNYPTLDLLYGELALRDNQLNIAEQKLMQYYTDYPSLNTASLLAEVLIKRNKSSDAVSYLDNELERTAYKTFADIHYVAELYNENGLYNNAIKHYRTLIELQPEDVVSLNNYASVLTKIGNHEDALPIAYKALKLVPASPYVLATVGWAAFKNGQVKESVTYLTNANKLLPNETEVQLRFIEVLIVDGQIDKAKSLIIQCEPSNSQQKTQLTLLKSMI